MSVSIMIVIALVAAQQDGAVGDPRTGCGGVATESCYTNQESDIRFSLADGGYRADFAAEKCISGRS